MVTHAAPGSKRASPRASVWGRWLLVGGRLALAGALAGALTSAVGTTACVSPTLPLPPPEVPSVTQGSEPNRYVLSAGPGGAEPDAFIITFNLNPTLARDQRVAGTQADELGRWRVEIWARPGDRVDVTQEVGTSRSPSLSITIPR
ncbi:MAG TPA: hypothetical protein PLR99_25095 [Polyangiaceae bacterium]|nr:hypothetical protein [Polyangiaceae bacterium]